ncbi:hypothetical protein C8034_v010619 [Colletotrichum sidae]|uniref:Uncharacterized protein n=1 Tax=Colletotrichum sidae TaxID=1347389 RepID=A0A4R8T9Z1_9PEZI|nr:hypothetical protein C8034_v010619 [Colletotrichum sidae]
MGFLHESANDQVQLAWYTTYICHSCVVRGVRRAARSVQTGVVMRFFVEADVMALLSAFGWAGLEVKDTDLRPGPDAEKIVAVDDTDSFRLVQSQAKNNMVDFEPFAGISIWGPNVVEQAAITRLGLHVS